MIKVLGSLIIIISSTFVGFFIASKYAGRTKQIRQLQNVLLYMETEILYGSTPLVQIVKQLAKREQGPLAELFRTISEEMEQNLSITFQKAWEKALELRWHKTFLKANEREILGQLGNALGRSDRINQQKHIKIALLHLQTEEQMALLEQQKYEKLSRTLGFLTGVLLVILMY